MSTSIRSILLFSVLLVTTPLASADIVTLTWTGTTLFDAPDNVGLFGPAGQLIPAGTIYSSTFVFDTDVSYIENGTNSTQEVTGGSFFDPDRASPLVGLAGLTINGMPAGLNGQFYASYFRQSGQGISRLSADAIAETGGNPLFNGQVFQRASRNDNLYGLPLDQPGSFSFGAGDTTDGIFAYRTLDAMGNLVAVTSFNLVPTSLMITVAVPEPGSLAVLVSRRGDNPVAAAIKVKPLAAWLDSTTFALVSGMARTTGVTRRFRP